MNNYGKLIKWLGGRKCFQVTMYSVILQAVLILASVVLAFMGKLTDQWVGLFKFYSGYSAALVIGYVIGNVKQDIVHTKKK